MTKSKITQFNFFYGQTRVAIATTTDIECGNFSFTTLNSDPVLVAGNRMGLIITRLKYIDVHLKTITEEVLH